MEGRGMGLTGPNIYIDRGANKLSMEGPGRMEIARGADVLAMEGPEKTQKVLDRDQANQLRSPPTPVKIDWQKSMIFDGRKAHFQDGVNVSNDSRLLQTGWLDVNFQRPISFSETGSQQPPPTVERLTCGDGVFVENRTVEAGQQASYDRMQFQNFDLNNISGDFHGDGPGRLISVRRGGSQGFAMPGGPLAAGGRPPIAQPVGFNRQQPGPTDPDQLTCTDLTFMNAVAGNKLRKDVVFHGRVRAKSAPAPLWTTTLESNDPNQLGPDAFVLQKCDHLEVHGMSPVSGSSSGNLELIALDNVIVEGTKFTARCARLTYSQAKDLLILEGDGRSDAQLFKQEGEGRQGTHINLRKILYFLKTNQVNTDGVRSFETNQAPGGTKK